MIAAYLLMLDGLIPALSQIPHRVRLSFQLPIEGNTLSALFLVDVRYESRSIRSAEFTAGLQIGRTS
jgi:hypothetical protein